MAAPEMINLPVVNLCEKHLTNPTARKKETDKILDSFSSLGFCLIEGIEEYDEESLLRRVNLLRRKTVLNFFKESVWFDAL